jgi:transposase
MTGFPHIGLARVHLQHILTGAAINLVRVGAWLLDIPRAKTRTSRFAALAMMVTLKQQVTAT